MLKENRLTCLFLILDFYLFYRIIRLIIFFFSVHFCPLLIEELSFDVVTRWLILKNNI